MSMIVDGTTKTMYMLMTEQHMYMEFPTDQNSPMTQRMPKFQDMFKGSDPCSGREGTTCKKLGLKPSTDAPVTSGRSPRRAAKQKLSGWTRSFTYQVISDITTNYTNIKEAQDASL